MITCKGVEALEFGFRGAAAEMPGRPLDNRLSRALSVLWRYNPFVFVLTGCLDAVLRERFHKMEDTVATFTIPLVGLLGTLETNLFYLLRL
jgi:hypothetical protein